MRNLIGTVHPRISDDEIEIEVSERLIHDFYVACADQKTVSILRKNYIVKGANYPQRGSRHFIVQLKLIPEDYIKLTPKRHILK